MLSRMIRAAGVVLLVATSTLSAQVGKTTALDPNRASEAELAALPGMTPALAKEVIAARPHLSMTAFDALLGKTLSKEQRTALYAKLWVHINLNNTTRDEILLIPNSGPRVVREFLEYAPYKALAVFRREMSKYWDATEVARLESYVFVPIDINTASDEDILSIPGSGPRVLREFKEYRPYTSIEQFRREMGKYWDAKEVSRLERYVMISPK
jgi:radical SAM superfamily enzyme with C-terminal helix-hairpin-helix motif